MYSCFVQLYSSALSVKHECILTKTHNLTNSFYTQQQRNTYAPSATMWLMEPTRTHQPTQINALHQHSLSTTLSKGEQTKTPEKTSTYCRSIHVQNPFAHRSLYKVYIVTLSFVWYISSIPRGSFFGKIHSHQAQLNKLADMYHPHTQSMFLLKPLPHEWHSWLQVSTQQIYSLFIRPVET